MGGGGLVSIQIRPTFVRLEDRYYHGYYPFYPYTHDYYYDYYGAYWPYSRNVYVRHTYGYPVSYYTYASYGRYDIYDDPFYRPSRVFYGAGLFDAAGDYGYAQSNYAGRPPGLLPEAAPGGAAGSQFSFATIVPEVNPLIDEGVAEFRRGRYQEARRLFIRATLEDRNDMYALVLYGYTWFAVGDYELASAVIRGAVSQSADLAPHPLDIRDVYRDPLILESQIDQLSGYMRTHPGDAGARFMLGYALYSLGDFDGARQVITPLIESDPEDRATSMILEAIR